MSNEENKSVPIVNPKADLRDPLLPHSENGSEDVPGPTDVIRPRPQPSDAGVFPPFTPSVNENGDEII